VGESVRLGNAAFSISMVLAAFIPMSERDLYPMAINKEVVRTNMINPAISARIILSETITIANIIASKIHITVM